MAPSSTRYLVKVAEKEDKAATVDMLKSLVGEQRAEELMGTWVEEYFEKGRVKGQVEGLAKGRAEAVLRVLAARHVSVDPQARQRILSCTDLATLELWLERAITAKHVSEVLDGASPS